METKVIPVFYPKSVTAWRNWLAKNHNKYDAVWVVFYTKAANKKTISWSESVDVALCYGWIYSKKIKIDTETSHQFFSRRKAKSTWSKINKQKIEHLIQSGLMTPEGHKTIITAKENGSWAILDDVEELVVPKDLQLAFKKKPLAKMNYDNFSRSVKKGILQWLVLAKRAETRENRINEVVSLAEQNLKPKHI